MNVAVSFIIPHKGRENMLVDTIEGIRSLDTKGFDVQIIIASQNSKIGIEVEKRLYPTVDLFLHVDPLATISKSRNIGASHSKADYLAFLDADILLSNDWLQVMKRELLHENLLLIGAKQRNSNNPNTLEKTRTVLYNANAGKLVGFLPGSNLFLKNERFIASGGFPEELTTCEDYFFSNAFSKMGKVKMTGATSFVHLGEDKSLVEMFRKEIWRGQSNLTALKGRTIPFSELPSIIAPMAISIGPFIALIGFISSNILIALIGAMLFLPLFLLYVGRLITLAKRDLTIIDIVKFYLFYFPARTIGTIGGVLTQLKTDTHSK